MRRAVVAFCALLSACGGGGAITSDLRARLASDELSAAQERAPDLIAQVEEALEDAEEAEARNDAAAAADHATRARLLLQAAVTEAARIADEEERQRIEARVAESLSQARRDEEARAAISHELARRASIRAAREEIARALTEAAEDEARPRRRARVSLEEARDVRRATEALQARARSTLAAAEALGAPAEALSAAREALTESEQAREPLDALDAADRAGREALRALGAARRELDGPGPDGASALAEAARAEGFEPLALPSGLAIEAEGLFSGGGLARDAAPKVERLAELIAAHPHGPVQVQASSRRDALAARRAEALRRALVRAGADEARLHAEPLPSSLTTADAADRARLLFVAYAATP